MSAEYQEFHRLPPQSSPGTATTQQHKPDTGAVSQAISPLCPYVNNHVMSFISCTMTFHDTKQTHSMQSTEMKGQIPL